MALTAEQATAPSSDGPTLSRQKEPQYITGRRAFFKYRELGLSAATDGKEDEGDEDNSRARLGPLVHMHTERARFRADEETAVPPSSGWWTEGLLRSFRDAVSPSATTATGTSTQPTFAVWGNGCSREPDRHAAVELSSS